MLSHCVYTVVCMQIYTVSHLLFESKRHSVLPASTPFLFTINPSPNYSRLHTTHNTVVLIQLNSTQHTTQERTWHCCFTYSPSVTGVTPLVAMPPAIWWPQHTKYPQTRPPKTLISPPILHPQTSTTYQNDEKELYFPFFITGQAHQA